MLPAFLLSFLICLLPTSAVPQHFPPWHPRQPGEARSACPGLNALANHGLLPRSGRNVDLETLRRAVTIGFNIDNFDVDPPAGVPRFADTIFATAITTNVDPNNTKTFDLDRASEHLYPLGPIEIDGSISRNDFYFGDQISFNPEIFGETWGVIEEGLANGEGAGNGTEITLALAAKARSVRVYNQSKRNPEFFFNGTVLTKSFGTSALYLSAIGDPLAGVANAEYVKILFEQERLPFFEGFDPRAKPQANLKTLGDLVGQFPAASPADIPCVFTPTQGPCLAPGAAAVNARGLHGFHNFHGF